MKTKPVRRRLIKKNVASSSTSTYHKDFYKWIKSQSSLLRSGEIEKLDIENLAEEIESLGKSDKRALKSFLIVLLLHLLKTHYQPSKRSISWQRSIDNARTEIALILEDSPSLKAEISKMLPSAYEFAKQKATIETGIPMSKFPTECPWKKDEVLK